MAKKHPNKLPYFQIHHRQGESINESINDIDLKLVMRHVTLQVTPKSHPKLTYLKHNTLFKESAIYIPAPFT